MTDRSDSASVNPYESPESESTGAAAVLVRWRIIPAVLGVCIGGLIALYGIAMLAIGAYFMYTEQGPWSREFLLPLIGGVLATVCGFSWLLAGIFCYLQKWQVASLLCLVGIVPLIAFVLLVLAFPNG